jgi:hypothetical protein
MLRGCDFMWQEEVLGEAAVLVTSEEALAERREGRGASEAAMKRAEAQYRTERSRIEEDVSHAVGEADDLEAAVRKRYDFVTPAGLQCYTFITH